MGNIKRKSDHLTDERKRAIINDIIHYFDKERGEKIGIVAAGQLLDLFLSTAGSELYNKGVTDARKALDQRLDDLRYDLEDLLDI